MALSGRYRELYLVQYRRAAQTPEAAEPSDLAAIGQRSAGGGWRTKARA